MIKIKKRTVLSGMILLSLTGLILLRVFDPATSGIFPPCPVRYLTGWYCPGCGSLRALHALLQGNLRQAWAMNALTVILLPFVSYGLGSELYSQFFGRRPARRILPARFIQGLAVVIVLFGILRNLPMYPFHLLAPGGLLRP